MEKTHDYRIDRLRLLACFGVVMLHSSHGAGIGDLALNAIFRFSVPVFVIISGYFLLTNRPSGIGNKILLLFLKMVLCSAIFLIYSLSKGGAMPQQPVKYLLSEPIHLWYLYATMGLYLLTPALVPFVRSADRREYRYALTVCFILGSCVLTLERLGWFPMMTLIVDKSKLPVMVGFTGLYLLGGYFRKFGFSKPGSWLFLWAVCSGINIAVSQSPLAENLLSFLSPNVILAGCSCFAVCMMLPDVPDRFRRPMQRLSECTMGVYLFHNLICDMITPHLQISQQLLGGMIAMAVRGICTFALTLVLVWLLRRILILKKWVL